MAHFVGNYGRACGDSLSEVVKYIMGYAATPPEWDGTTICRYCRQNKPGGLRPEFVVYKDSTDWNVGYKDTEGVERPLLFVAIPLEGDDCDVPWTAAEAEAVCRLVKVMWDSHIERKATPEVPEDDLIGMYRTTYDIQDGVDRRREVIRKLDRGDGYMVRFPDDNDPHYEGFYFTSDILEYIENGEWVKIS